MGGTGQELPFLLCSVVPGHDPPASRAPTLSSCLRGASQPRHPPDRAWLLLLTMQQGIFCLFHNLGAKHPHQLLKIQILPGTRST